MNNKISKIQSKETIETLSNGETFKVTEYMEPNQNNLNNNNMSKTKKKNAKNFPPRKPVSYEDFLISFSNLPRIQATKLNVYKQITQLMSELEQKTRNLNKYERDVIVKNAYIQCDEALNHIQIAYANKHQPNKHLQHLENAKQKLSDVFCNIRKLYQIGNMSKKVSTQLYGTLYVPINSLTNMINARHREINNLRKSDI
jgi:hypothetical protein